MKRIILRALPMLFMVALIAACWWVGHVARQDALKRPTRIVHTANGYAVERRHGLLVGWARFRTFETLAEAEKNCRWWADIDAADLAAQNFKEEVVKRVQ